MIDKDGYRPNIGIIVTNEKGLVLWAKRIGQNAWQFPQGGIQHEESLEVALYRELYEELGLTPEHVAIVACTKRWLRYRLPKYLQRQNYKPLCIGQKQKWFLLKLVGNDTDVHLNRSDDPEFDGWRWVSYWYPLQQVIHFKRQVYRRALQELAPFMKRVRVEKKI